MTYVDSGPRGGLYRPPKTKGRTKGETKPKQEHKRTFYVDNIECPDIDAVLTMLNAEPVRNESEATP